MNFLMSLAPLMVMASPTVSTLLFVSHNECMHAYIMLMYVYTIFLNGNDKSVHNCKLSYILETVAILSS